MELLRILILGYETIYYEKGDQRLVSTDQRHNLAVLNILAPLIESWYNNYRSLLEIREGEVLSLNQRRNKRKAFEMSRQINTETMISDYYYCQLYIYSLALQVDVEENKLKLNEIRRCASFVEKAYIAAKEILESAGRVHKLNMLKYMPVRWVLRIVRSVAFIVKCYLTLTCSDLSTNPEANTILRLSAISVDETIQTIQTAAITLKEAAPDELHLCTRYSAILMYLCREMKLRDKTNNNNNTGENEEQKILIENSNPDGVEGVASNFGNVPSTLPPSYAQKSTTKEQLSDDGAHSMSFMDEGPSLSNNVTDWFNVGGDIGLDFVEPWTEMIEQRYLQSGDVNTSFEELYRQLCEPFNEHSTDGS